MFNVTSGFHQICDTLIYGDRSCRLGTAETVGTVTSFPGDPHRVSARYQIRKSRDQQAQGQGRVETLRPEIVDIDDKLAVKKVEKWDETWSCNYSSKTS